MVPTTGFGALKFQTTNFSLRDFASPIFFSFFFFSDPLLTQQSPSPNTSEGLLEEILSLTAWLLILHFYWPYLSQIFAQLFKAKEAFI